MKLFHKIVFFSLMLLLFSAKVSSAAIDTLPDLEGWTGEDLFSQQLEAPSGNYGIWRKRRYIAPGGRNFSLTVLSGSGSGDLYIPEKEVNTDDRPMGFGATYRTLSLGKYRALLESYPQVGKALSIRLPEHTTLSVESKSLEEEELFRVTQEILFQLENKEN
ncbi:MAG: hypothetical protein PHR17_06765 [Aminobacterium sp.]|nr:hypothetical protein [Aminobacterium sp.]